MTTEISPGDLLDPKDLAKLPKNFIIIKRRLLLRKALTLYTRVGSDYLPTFKCRIAIGAYGHETPGGPGMIKAKLRHPDWHMPNSEWVPKEDRGKVVPGNTPENPIKEAFLKITDDGVGIHGTDNLLSLGTKASHGCVRVSRESAIHLYENVQVGSPIYIA